MALLDKSAKRFVVGLIIGFVASFCWAVVTCGQAATFGLVTNNANLRAGPATSYAITGKATQGQTLTLVGKDPSGDWYHLASGEWIAAFLVDVETKALILIPTPVAKAKTNALILVPTVLPSVQPTTAPTPQATSIPVPIKLTVIAQRDANLRGGPGTNYPVTGSVSTGQTLTLKGRTDDSSWFQLASGAWIAAFLVNQSAPTVVAAPTAPPAAPSAATPAPVSSGNDFVMIEKHLWNPYENGGSTDGPSVHCGLARELIVNVLDANGNRLNGVAVQVQYGAHEIYVTGSQGKGDGVAEFVLGSGQDVKVIRDTDGRERATSDLVTGLVTNAQFIPYETLIASDYCQDAASCKNFADTYSCEGHFSWTVTFKRQH